MSEKIKHTCFSKTVIIPMVIILIAALCGSISAGRISEAECDNLSGYLVNFFKDVPGIDKTLLYSSLKKHITVWFMIAVSGCILPAFLLNVATVWERGFVIGYTAAGFCRVYGLKGVTACVALFPEMVFFIPVLAIFSSFSLKMSFLSHENKKVFFGKYIFSVIFFLSVFCGISVFQTFLTTTFMRWISSGM